MKGTSASPRRPSPARDPSEGPPDREVILQVLQGRSEVFRILVERYQRKVFNLSLRYLWGDHGRAADASQEIFLKTYRGLKSFQENSLFSTWLHRIAVNHLIGEIRKDRALKRGRTISLDGAGVNEDGEEKRIQVGDEKDEPGRRVDQEEKRNLILKAIDQLDKDLRMTVVLRELQGHSYEEIAEIVSVPVGTVRSRLHRARELLREKLQSLIEE